MKAINTGVLLVAGLLGGIGVQAQQMQGGCLRLLGSVACPAFSYAYLSPGNLTNAFPFFSTVTDVASFDAAALNYFSNPYQFQTTKFGSSELGCANASAAVIQYERTVLCSMWVNEKWSIECEALYNSTTAATSQKMVCQSTCLQYSASEYAIVNSSTYCPGADLTNGARDTQLVKDFTDCTNWTTLATNDSATCIQGSDNEGNCGFAGSTAQLCDFCAGTSPDDCCYAGTTDMSVCGYALPVRNGSTSTSSSVPGPTTSAATGLGDNAASSSSKLKGGKLAGTIVGAIIGGILLLALLLLLLLCCRRRRRDDRNKRDSGSSFAASQAGPATGFGAGGVFGSFFGGHRHSGPQNTSEKGLLGQHSAALASSPTMGGDTLYTPSMNALSSPDVTKNGNGNGNGNGKVMGGLAVPAAFGAGAGAAAAGFGDGPGARSSGIMLPRVRDENQGGDRWIEPGMEVLVLWPYQAALPDELELRQGMKLRILRLYDDAWGTAEVIASSEQGEVGKQGAFPIVCVSEGSSLGHTPTSSAESH